MTDDKCPKISRRDVIKTGLTGCAACMMLPLISGRSEAEDGVSRTAKDYYALNRDKYMSVYKNIADGIEENVSLDVGKADAKKIRIQADAQFEKLYDSLPDVGGEKNLNLIYLIISASYLAFYPSMDKAGRTARDFGKNILSMYESFMEQQTPEQNKQLQEAYFSEKNRQEFREYSLWTQKKEFPMNWIAEYKEGNGVDFDWGYNYSRCSIVEFFKSWNAPDLAYYMCLTDFVRSRTIGTGLERTQTLAMGDSCCNFRYKKGREVKNDWKMELYET
jgi:hypothetical protein